jgi:hypothetical protein
VFPSEDISIQKTISPHNVIFEITTGTAELLTSTATTQIFESHTYTVFQSKEVTTQ